ASNSQTASVQPNADATIGGFTREHSRTQRDRETKFKNGVSPDNLRESMRRLTARPHHVGSPYDKDNAEWMLARFKEWGFDAHIETFQVLFPTPKERLVELVEPTSFRAKMQEPVLPADPTTSQTSEQLPTYNAYSIDGDVTAPLIYVNYGNREDYEQLDRLGISVKGAIVIARYGEGWRGIKPKVAAEHGAVGCIIYSDPRGDGYFNGEDYPKGGWRPRDGVQRGSVMDTDYPGDPLTPGVGATSDAKRLAIREAKTITKIPVLPISYGDALPLLSALKGQVAPEAWVNGADDPVSGMAAVLEEARMLGELHKQGWNPKRTIIYCAWDGEEPGLLGSTEWVETHLAELQKHAVAYINSDSNERGFLHVSGSHDLERFINDVARDVQDPEKNMSVWKRAHL